MIVHNKKSGFTILELLLYVSIASIMFVAITVFIATLLESRVKNQTIAEVEQQGLFAAQMMTRIIRNADTLSTPTIGTTGTSATLTVIDGAKSPTVFDLSGGVIRIKEGAGSATALTNSRVTVSGLSFQNLSRAGTQGTLRIQYTVTSNNPSGRFEYQFQKTFITTATLRQP
ncbi:MAG: prepilin-type N-terminal cleavage/methylation domain-containing protein [Candidatus Moraniibacteriota bacterium]